MDFGGPQGERLALLNRVTPFLDERGRLRGMAFFYDDGTERVFGSRRIFEDSIASTICPEPSFEIRGSAGERIVRIGFIEPAAEYRSPNFQVRHPQREGHIPPLLSITRA